MNAWAQIVDNHMKVEPLPAPKQTETKQCKACGNTKPVDAFYSRFPYRNGYTTKCKRCIIDAKKQENRGIS